MQKTNLQTVWNFTHGVEFHTQCKIYTHCKILHSVFSGEDCIGLEFLSPHIQSRVEGVHIQSMTRSQVEVIVVISMRSQSMLCHMYESSPNFKRESVSGEVSSPWESLTKAVYGVRPDNFLPTRSKLPVFLLIQPTFEDSDSNSHKENRILVMKSLLNMLGNIFS